MAVALASSPAASVRALQRCVVGHASGCSRFLLLRASPAQSQLQSQPLKCGGACSKKLGGSIVGSRLQRFSIVASSMGSPTPSQVGFGLLPWFLGSGTIQFLPFCLERQTSGLCIGNVFWIGASAWIASNMGYVVGCLCRWTWWFGHGVIWILVPIRNNRMQFICCHCLWRRTNWGYWLEWFLDDNLCWNWLKQGYVVRAFPSEPDELGMVVSVWMRFWCQLEM